MMKKSLLIVAGICLLLFGMASSALADPAASAVAHVYMNVAPNIAVEAVDANVDAGTLQTGERQVPITFRVDANTQAVAMSVLVTQLYKGNDPTNTEVNPVRISTPRGVAIDPDNANEVNGGDGVAMYVGPSSMTNEKGTFEGMETEVLTFESSQNAHFSQNVEVTPTWVNTDNEQPQGQYSGYVVLYAAVL